MLVRHAMTAEVISFAETERCVDALARMRKERIRRAPILRDGHLVGMISERDLLRVLPYTVGGLQRAETEGALDTRLRAVMAVNVIKVSSTDHLEDVARLLLKHKIGGMPVVDEGRLVGVVTESDVFRVFVGLSAGREDLRVTITVPEPTPQPARGRPREQPAAVCLRLGLELIGLLTHDAPGGARMVTLRVSGKRTDELASQLSANDYSVIEVQHPNSSVGT